MKPSRTTKVLPRSTCSTPATSRPNVSWKVLACSGVIVMGCPLGVTGSVGGVGPGEGAGERRAVRGDGHDEIGVLVTEEPPADHLAELVIRRGVRGAAGEAHRVVPGG